MKRQNCGFLLCTLVFLTSCTSDGPLSAEEENTIKSAVGESFDGLIAASKEFDFDRYLEFFDMDRFSGLNEDGTVTHSIREFDETYRDLFSIPVAYESLEFTRVKISVIDKNTAVLVNEFQAIVRLESGDKVAAAGGGSQTWSQTSGKWKLVSVASSSRTVDR